MDYISNRYVYLTYTWIGTFTQFFFSRTGPHPLNHNSRKQIQITSRYRDEFSAQAPLYSFQQTVRCAFAMFNESLFTQNAKYILKVMSCDVARVRYYGSATSGDNVRQHDEATILTTMCHCCQLIPLQITQRLLFILSLARARAPSFPPTLFHMHHFDVFRYMPRSFTFFFLPFASSHIFALIFSGR